MEETNLTKEATNQNIEISEEQKNHNAIIDSVIDKLNNNDFNIYFYCPPMNTPSGGIGVIFNQVKILQDHGFKPCIIYEPVLDKNASFLESQKRRDKVQICQKFNPTWLGETAKDVKMLCLGEGEITFTDQTKVQADKIVINPEDFVIIPEGFPNIMERFGSLPCKTIVFAQSWYYILNNLRLNESWANFKIRDVISISDGITKYLNALMPGMRIKNYSQSIDREIFKPKPIVEKFPKIAFMAGRTEEARNKTYNVIKTFYLCYPQYRWIRFDELRDLSKQEFSDRIAESAFVLYTDEIAGFGTMPLEAMACGTHVIGWTPLGSEEYINHEQSGYWAVNGNVFHLVEMIALALDQYFASVLDRKEIQDRYETILERYTKDKEKESILQIYNEYKNERIAELHLIKQ